jgi:hypothetical protein
MEKGTVIWLPSGFFFYPRTHRKWTLEELKKCLMDMLRFLSLKAAEDK